MEQLSLFDEPLPYKYIIDSSSMISQKADEIHRRKVSKRMWEWIDSLVRDKIIVTCTEISSEVDDDEMVKNWLKSERCVVLPVDDQIQRNVITVVTQQPLLIDFRKMKSSGDAFLIATAMKYNLVIITEERKNSPKKIPQVAASLGIESVNIIELCEREDKEF